MKASKRFSTFTNGELISWWGQYGRQAHSYRQAPRRACWKELRRRGLASPAANSWNYTSGWFVS